MPDPDWLRANYKDAQGKPRRIITASSEDALQKYAQKQGKQVESTFERTRMANVRSGTIVKQKLVRQWYGLLSP